MEFTVITSAGIGEDGSDSLLCVADIISNLVGTPEIQLMRNGTPVGSTAGLMLLYSLSDSEEGAYTCIVCITVAEAGILDHCNETRVLVGSKEGKYT